MSLRMPGVPVPAAARMSLHGARLVACAACVAVALTAAPARAGDGFYVVESYGVGAGHGQLAAVVGATMHLRLGVGMRFGNLAIEPWFASDLQTDRRGGFRGLIGGDPAPGTADLTAMGLDAKYFVPLDRHIDVFVRGGPLVTEGNGALEGYRGRGLGMAAGAMLSGEVRALGFLWAPFFFMKRGPLVTGALYLDAGYDASFLRKPGCPPIDAGVAHVSIGFGIGSVF